jgi:hypothetical protein
MKIGRNGPCPCGSGKKYKHCCLSPTSALKDELHKLIAEQEFDSIEDLQAITDDFISQRNRQPQDDFHGLSPEKMHRLLAFPFESPSLFHFPETLPTVPGAPILTLTQAIVQATGDKGLKATAKGNLPQKLCRDAAHDHCQDLPPDDFHHFTKVNKEDDFPELHVTRIILEMTGLLRKTKGRFYLTRKFHRLVDRSGLTRLYPEIFKTYCREFNWGYWDGYQELPFLQQSFLFTLHLLARYGDDWKPSGFYEDCFIQAFPMILDEVEPTAWSSAEDHVRSCFTHRVLKLFLHFMGLARVEKIPGDKPYSRDYRIRKLPLMDEVVHFVF